MVRLSIIIPAVGGQHQLEDTLVSVLSNRPDDCEVLVVQPGPYDDPYDLGDEVRFVTTDGLTDHLELATAGIQASRGDVVHLLHPGIEAVDGWTELPLRWFRRDPSVASVSPLIVANDDHGQTISAGVRYRLGGRRSVTGAGGSTLKIASYRGEVDGPTTLGAFYRRSAIFDAGGFDPLVGDQLADVDLAIRLQRLGYRCVFEPNRPLVGRSVGLHDPHSSFHQGRCAERLFWRHVSHGGRLRSLLMHPIDMAIDSLSQAPRLAAITRFAGRLVAMGEVVLGKHLGSAPADDAARDHSDSALADDQGNVNHSTLREAG